jgi:hypothetical protein
LVEQPRRVPVVVLDETPWAAERARERLDRVVAGVEAGVGYARAATELPGGALEQQPPPERRGGLTDAGADESVEVVGAVTHLLSSISTTAKSCVWLA